MHLSRLLWGGICLLALVHLIVSEECPQNNRCSIHCFFHGDCQTDGSCKCHEGWRGENCTEPTCDSCGRHGSCTGTGCVCSVGWKGPHCDILEGVLPYHNPFCDPFGQCKCSADGAPCAEGIGPDLIPVKDSIKPFIEYKHFGKCHCAVDEGCAKEGDRKLLRFTMETLNQGTADLFIGASEDYTDRYIWHQCHHHPHYVHWTQFVLRPKFQTSHNNTRIGFKSGASIIDSRRYDRNAPGRHKYTDKKQGVSIGWTDWYPYWLDCQWIDVTGLELGPYELEVWANPDGIIHEINHDNNKVVIDVDCNPRCGPNALCDFGHSCVCKEGFSGSDCHPHPSRGTAS